MIGEFLLYGLTAATFVIAALLVAGLYSDYLRDKEDE